MPAFVLKTFPERVCITRFVINATYCSKCISIAYNYITVVNFKFYTCNCLQWLHCCGTQAVIWINIDSISIKYFFWHSFFSVWYYYGPTYPKFMLEIYTLELTPTSAMGNNMVILPVPIQSINWLWSAMKIPLVIIYCCVGFKTLHVVTLGIFNLFFA